MQSAIKVEQFACRLRQAVISFAVLLAAATVVSIVRPVTPGSGGPYLNQDALPFVWAASAAAWSVFLVEAGLFELCRMLRLVERQAYFSAKAARHLQRFAGFLIASTVSAIFLPPLIVMFNGSKGVGHGAVTIDGSDGLLLLISSIFFLVAKLLSVAARYEADSHSIV